MRKFAFPILVLLIVVAAATALAAPNKFIAHLAGQNEVPPVDSSAQGQVKFKLADDGLHFKLITANIIGVTQAHIHCGPEGANGPVVAFLYGFNAAGVDNNGVLAEGVITPANVIPRPHSAVCPGGVADFDDLLEKMSSGGTYVNTHTLSVPSGEIRGQIRPIGSK
ncbi:MAG: CHRD domain-containing protein [Chloroflexi bacterium]|nr:CHRD domain-containing protein [Chloroflexota bacterium]